MLRHTVVVLKLPKIKVRIVNKWKNAIDYYVSQYNRALHRVSTYDYEIVDDLEISLNISLVALNALAPGIM